MNPKPLLATVFLLGPGLSTPLQAETWGLERATAYALENNPELQAARAQRGLDVETGKPFDPAVPPIDPRIRR